MECNNNVDKNICQHTGIYACVPFTIDKIIFTKRICILNAFRL